jgi:hypothetical protein
VIELEEEPKEDNPAPQSIQKEVAPVKGKGKGRKVVLMPLFKFLLVLTPRLPFNALLLHPPPWLEVQPPLILPLPSIMLLFVPIAIQPSHLCLARGRLLHRILLSLIENVDMGEFIEDLMKMKVPPSAYRCIQDFLTKVYMPFSSKHQAQDSHRH